MIGEYLNQTATLKRVTGYNADGSPSMSSASILARWQYATKLLRGANAETIISGAQVYTTTAVNVGDHLIDPDGNEWTALRARREILLDGGTSHYQVLLGATGIGA